MSVTIKYTDDYYTTSQAAVELGVDTDTVKKYCNCDPQRIKGEKIGNSWMIPQSEIERYRKEKNSMGRPKKYQQK